MTWELLLVFVVIGAALGGAWAYTKRKKSPFGRSLSQEVRDRANPPKGDQH